MQQSRNVYCWLGVFGILLCCIAVQSASEAQCRCSGLQIKRVDKTSGNCSCWECPNCNEGMGSSVPCASVVSMEVSIECVFCVNHFNFSDGPGRGQCRTCSVCLKHELVVRKCLYNNDIECGDCKAGFYRDEITDDCFQLPTFSEASISSSGVATTTPSSTQSNLHPTPSLVSTPHQNFKQFTALQVTSSVSTATASSSSVASIEGGQLQESNIVNINAKEKEDKTGTKYSLGMAILAGIISGVGMFLAFAAATVLILYYLYKTQRWPQFLTPSPDSDSIRYDVRHEALVRGEEGRNCLLSGENAVLDPLLDRNQPQDISSPDLSMDGTRSVSTLSTNESEADEGSFLQDSHDDQTREAVEDVRNSIQPERPAEVHNAAPDNEFWLENEAVPVQPPHQATPLPTDTSRKYSRKITQIPKPLLQSICLLLDIERTVDWNDYRMLASELGLNPSQIEHLKQTCSQRTYKLLMEVFSAKENSGTLFNLIEILKKMERHDVIEEIDNWVENGS